MRHINKPAYLPKIYSRGGVRVSCALWGCMVVWGMVRAFLFCFVMCWPGLGQAQDVTVFSAASLKGAMDPIAQLYSQTMSGDMVVSYGASSALARQIQFGAPADIFVSANAAWSALVDPDGQGQVIASNTLILAGLTVGQTPLTQDGLNATLGDGLLAIPFPDAVPLGQYGRDALQRLGVWAGLQGRLAQTDSAASAYALLRRGQVPLAVLYGSYAAQDPRLVVHAQIDPDLHDPITYVAVPVTQTGRQAIAFLISDQAQQILQTAGFGPAPGP